jgi:hypothetical protein
MFAAYGYYLHLKILISFDFILEEHRVPLG